MSCDVASVGAALQALASLNTIDEKDRPSTLSNAGDIPPYLLLEDAETADKLRLVATLAALAKQMGAQKARSEMVPLLDKAIASAIENGDDELCLAISNQVGKLVTLMGGASHVHLLLPLLSRILCQVEEVVVTEGAADACVLVIQALPAAMVESKVLPLIKLVFEDDLFCSSRKAGARLLAPAYAKITHQEHKLELVKRLLSTAENDDEIPLVREAAILQMGVLSGHAPASLRTELFQKLLALYQDNHREVRCAVIKTLPGVAKNGGSDKEVETQLFPCLEKVVDDFRNVRQALASNLPAFQSITAKVNKSLATVFIRLLEDNDPEVRKVSAKTLCAFAESAPKDLHDVLVPKVKEHLTTETDDKVKAEIISETVKLLGKMKKDDSVQVTSSILNMLTDTSSAAKQAVFNHLSVILPKLPAAELKATVLPNLIKLYADKSWRVRYGIVNNIASALPLIDVTTAKDTLLPVIVTWLRDPACDIRDAACRVLGCTVKAHTACVEPLKSSVELSKLATDSNYQFRKAWLAAVVAVCVAVGAATTPHFLPKVLELCADVVPNVRMCAVRAVRQLIPVTEPSRIQKDVLPCVQRLIKDDDQDVKFLAEEALASLPPKQ